MSIISLISNQGIKNASASIEDVSKRFATGERLTKPSEDLFASIQIATGREKLTYYDSALASLQRLRSVLATRNGSLKTMQNGVQQLESLALRSSSIISDQERSSAVVSFNQVMSRVANIATTSEYAGIKLLDGSFGGSQGFSPAGTGSYNLSVIRDPGTAAGGLAPAVEANSNRAITFVSAPQAGDTVTVGGKTVTFISDKSGEDASKGLVYKGDSLSESARNLITALNSMTDTGALKYTYSINTANPAQVVVSTLYSSGATIIPASDVVVNAGARITNTSNAGTAAMFDFTGYVDDGSCKGALGDLTNTGRQAGSDGANGALYTTFVNGLGFKNTSAAYAALNNITAGGNAGDVIASFSFKIGTVDYVGAMAYNAAGASTDTMYCRKASETNADDNQTFKVNFAAPKAIDAGGANQLADWNGGNAGITVCNDQRMNFDTGGGDIFDTNANKIGSVNGMAIQLKSSNLDGYKVIGVEATNRVFTFKLSDGDVTKTFVSGNTNAVDVAKAGEILTCTCAETNEVLTFVVGNTDLDISSKDNQQLIQRAIFSAISSDNASFIVGTDVTQTLDMKLADMSWEVLTGDKDLDLGTLDSSRETVTLLQGIITKINSEIAVNAAYDLAVSSLVEQTNVSKENLTSAVEALSNVDITAEKTQLDNMMTLVRASVTAMTTDLQLRRAIEQVLNQ